MENDGIVFDGTRDFLKKKDNINWQTDIYKVIVTTKKGEKKKLNEVVMSLDEDQKALVKDQVDCGSNIFEALSCIDIIEIGDYLDFIEHDSSIYDFLKDLPN